MITPTGMPTELNYGQTYTVTIDHPFQFAWLRLSRINSDGTYSSYPMDYELQNPLKLRIPGRLSAYFKGYPPGLYYIEIRVDNEIEGYQVRLS